MLKGIPSINKPQNKMNKIEKAGVSLLIIANLALLIINLVSKKSSRDKENNRVKGTDCSEDGGSCVSGQLL